MALEHFTAILAHQLLANPRHLAGGRRGNGRPVALARVRGDRAQGRRLRHLAACDAALAAVQAVEGQGEGDALRHPQLPRRPHGGRARVDAPGRRHRPSRLVAAAVVSVGPARHVPQDRAAPGSNSSCPDSTRGTRTTAHLLGPTTRARSRDAAASSLGEEGAGSAAYEPPALRAPRLRRLRASSLRAVRSSRISRAGTSAPRAQLSRGAMIPSGSKPSFSSTRAEAGLSRKCEPSRLREAERPGDVDQRRCRLRSRSRGPRWDVRDPIAHLDRARRTPAEPARADQLRRAARSARRSGTTAGPGRAGWARTPRRRACGRATARSRDCARSPRPRSPRQAPARLPGSPASAAVLAFSRTSSFSSPAACSGR